MSVNPISFCNERTIEYALVPILQRHLAKHFGSAIPIFFWKNREGNRFAEQIHSALNVKLLAMFARRPKLRSIREAPSWRINWELREFSHLASKLGVVTIAGLPAATSLSSLYEESLKVFWLPVASCADEFFFSVVVEGGTELCLMGTGSTEEKYEAHPASTWSLGDIVSAIETSAQSMPWETAMDHLAELRSLTGGTSSFFSFIGGYRPVYFLVPA